MTAPVTSAAVSLDERGLAVRQPVGLQDGTVTVDVYCDDRHVWSTTVNGGSEPPILVPWPRAMRSFLRGSAAFRVEMAGEVVLDELVTFGNSTDRIDFRDKAGIPIMIDKWGLIQRPFTGRGDGVIEQMVEITEQMLQTLREDCGVEAWIAFGTLLGAARSGGVIGHDSDIDLAYVSRHETPAAMAQEMFQITRALRRSGMNVVVKSGSFITVMFEAADGGNASIDLYTCFYLGDLLHETATVRAPVPRSAIEPLTELVFEGRALPAPSDPDVVLTASYGPGWRTPDPSFRHEPGPDIARRFDGWFGSLMRQRRDWERTLRLEPGGVDGEASSFVRWLEPDLDRGSSVVDVGCGRGIDALHLGSHGHQVVGLDYARGVTRAAAERARDQGLSVSFAMTNLLSLRDTLTQVSVLARQERPPTAIVARDLLPALAPDAIENFWRLVELLLRSGGRAYIENTRGASTTQGGARRRGVERDDVVRAARAAGANGVRHSLGRSADDQTTDRWVLHWDGEDRR